MRHFVSWWIVLLSVGCRSEALDSRPESVVEELVMRLQRVHGEPKAAKAAYDLLWSEARQNLAERAKRASFAAGRKVAPEEMIAPSRFTLRFEPSKYSARIEGNWAVVTVTGEIPATQRSEVRCVREDGAWRVVLEVPALPPIQKRSEALRATIIE